MKSFKKFISEKSEALTGHLEKGTTYYASGETVGGKTPEQAVSAAEQDAKKRAAARAKEIRDTLKPRKSGREKNVLDAADDAMRAGSNTPGRGSSGRSGANILDDLLGKPPASDIKPGPKSSSKTPEKPPVVKQSEVSQQAKSYRTAQGEKKYQATKLDQDVRRSFPTGKGGLKADETNPYVKRSVRQARSTRLGGDIFDAPSVGNRPFRALTKKTKTGTVITNIPDPFAGTGTSVPKKTKKAGAPPRTTLKQVVADLKASRERLARGSSGYNLGGLPLDRSVPKAPPKIKRPKIGSGTASGYTIDNSPQPGSEVVKYTGAKAKGSSSISKGSALVKATKGDGIPDAMKRGAYDAAMKRKRLEDVVGKYAQAASKQTDAIRDELKAQQKSQRRQQAKVRLKGMKSAARVRGASGALGLGIAAYDAYQTYKKAKSQGSSDTRSALRGITKAAGGALAGGLAGAAGSALGGPLAGLAVGGAAYSYGADAAEKAFMAAAGPNKLKLADMARKNRLVQKGTSAADATFKMGNKAIIKDKQGKERIGYAAKLTDKQGNVKTVYKHGASSQARKYTSSNAIERLGRNIPFLQGYYTRKDEADRVKKVADFKAKATGSK